MAKILIIEDNKDDSLIMERALKNLGHVNIVHVCTGEEGINKARDEKPDLIITDIFLPGMDGFEVCRKIKNLKELSPTKVFILTGLTNDSDAKKAAKAGADAYIAKTGDYLPLVEKVKKVYGRADAHELPDILREQMKNQREKWISIFPKKIKRMEEISDVLRVKYKKKPFKDLYHLVHNLAGSARVFCLTSLTEKAEPLEILLNSIINKNTAPTIKELSKIDDYICALKRLSLKSHYKKAFAQKKDEKAFYQQF